MYRTAYWFLLLGGVWVLSAGPSHSQNPLEADSVTPLPSSFNQLKQTLEIDGQQVPVVISYAVQGDKVFILPVWYVPHIRRVAADGTRIPVKPHDRVLDGAQTVADIELKIEDLLEEDAHRTKIRNLVRKRIAEDRSKDPNELKLTFEQPQIKQDAYLFGLSAAGVQNYAISDQNSRNFNHQVRLKIDRAAVERVEKESGQPLLFGDTALRCTGQMRVRLEQLQLYAQINVTRESLHQLHKALRSLKDGQGRSPDAFIEYDSTTGVVRSANSILQMARQHVLVSLAVRQNAADSVIAPRMVENMVDKLLEQCRMQIADENKCVSFLINGQVAITAPLGEIHRLAQADENARTEAMNKMIDDFKARYSKDHNKESSTSTISARVFWIGGQYSRTETTEKQYEQLNADQYKQAEETLKHGFDRLMRDFRGNVPTLTGISFDDQAIYKGSQQLQQELKQMTFTTEYILFAWPLVQLTGGVDNNLTPEQMHQSYATLKSDYDNLKRRMDELAKDLGTHHRVAQVKERLDRLDKICLELTKVLAESERKLKDFDQQARVRFGLLDQTEIQKHQEQIDKLVKQAQELSRQIARLRGNAFVYMRYMEHPAAVEEVSLHPKHRWLAVACVDKNVHIWDYTNGKKVRTLQGHTDSVWSVAWSPDGQYLASGSDDNTVRVWEASSGKLLRTLQGHTDWVFSVAWSPDGQYLASGSSDKTVRVWEASSGKLLRTLQGHTDRVRSVAWSPDGQYLASGRETSIQIWQLFEFEL